MECAGERYAISRDSVRERCDICDCPPTRHLHRDRHREAKLHDLLQAGFPLAFTNAHVGVEHVMCARD